MCMVCQHRRGRAVTVEIEHPPGEEIQWDWLELHETPWGEPAFVLVGALSHSGPLPRRVLRADDLRALARQRCPARFSHSGGTPQCPAPASFQDPLEPGDLQAHSGL